MHRRVMGGLINASERRIDDCEAGDQASRMSTPGSQSALRSRSRDITAPAPFCFCRHLSQPAFSAGDLPPRTFIRERLAQSGG
jgi:hypothetical protein